jgi:hypothetical protein
MNELPIIKILCDNNLINQYIDLHLLNSYPTINIKLIRLLKFSKFLNCNKVKYIHNYVFVKYIIKNNYILHHIRMYVKKWKKNKFLLFKNKMISVIDELLNYKPNNKKILKNGSHNYNLELQSFNNQNYNIKCNSIPYYTLPHHDILHKYELNAEYDEVNDTYIIYDINIPHMLLQDRKELLLKLYNTPTKKNEPKSEILVEHLIKWIYK